MYDYVIAGAGFSGGILARELAEKLNKKVLVLDRRNHIAGNMYDEYDANGILVQRYGPHTFVTDNAEVIQYINRFVPWHDYFITAQVEIDGKLMPMPFNYKSIEMLYEKTRAHSLIQELEKAFPGQRRVPVFSLTEHDSPNISEFGRLLCEKDYIPYTSKQWGINPEDIDKSVIERVKVALSYDENYMQQKYQVMPEHSFTEFFTNLLNHKNITVQLNSDILKYLKVNYEKNKILFMDAEVPIIFTGPIDELFDCRYGRLPYRSLNIEFQSHDRDYYQKAPFIAYPQAKDYTRITEYKYLTGQKKSDRTTISIEYPLNYDPEERVGNIPYYPVICEKNHEMYSRYRVLADKFHNLFVCGRLGDYKYYNMDQAILRAFQVFHNIELRK